MENFTVATISSPLVHSGDSVEVKIKVLQAKVPETSKSAELSSDEPAQCSCPSCAFNLVLSFYSVKIKGKGVPVGWSHGEQHLCQGRQQSLKWFGLHNVLLLFVLVPLAV